MYNREYTPENDIVQDIQDIHNRNYKIIRQK